MKPRPAEKCISSLMAVPFRQGPCLAFRLDKRYMTKKPLRQLGDLVPLLMSSIAVSMSCISLAVSRLECKIIIAVPISLCELGE